MKQLLAAILVALCGLECGCSVKNAAETADSSEELASVNGEILDLGDFERSQSWLPSFARQLESNTTIEVSRFWALIQIMLMAQDAKQAGYLSDVERSLAMKEALAARNIERIPYPNYVVSSSEIEAWLTSHSQEVLEPEAFTVNYALVKKAQTISTLNLAHGVMRGAQMGYNFVDPPELNLKKLPSGPLLKNIDGHSMHPQKFDLMFATVANENSDEQSQIGPFTKEDGLLFSCPAAIEALSKAPIGWPIKQSIACSGDWKAFVIPAWHREAAPMNIEKQRQIAVEKLTADKRAAFREQYLDEKLSRMAQP